MKNFVMGRNNKDYIFHKLLPSFMGKESYLKDIFLQIEMRLTDCRHALEAGGEFSVLFWPYLCNLVKNEIRIKKDPLAEDIAVLQSACIMEVLTRYYKQRAVEAKEKERALTLLKHRLEQLPFIYTMEDILKFTDSSSQPLLGKYTEEDLKEFIKTKTTESRDNKLPDLFIFHGKKEERFFVAKDKVLPLCVKLLREAHGLVGKNITKRWLRIIRDFRSETAMEKDADFEKLLISITGQLVPALNMILGDKRLYLIYSEVEHSQGELPAASKIFTKT
jgi:hypothetical protein